MAGGAPVTSAAAGWALAAGGGALVALLYLAGLWWTVQRVPRTRHPVALVAGSYVLRAMMVVGALVLIMNGDVVRLLAALGGFLLVRALVLRKVRAGVHRPHAVASRE
jgi:F1F0 ATPase subunit 2